MNDPIEVLRSDVLGNVPAEEALAALEQIKTELERWERTAKANVAIVTEHQETIARLRGTVEARNDYIAELRQALAERVSLLTPPVLGSGDPPHPATSHAEGRQTQDRSRAEGPR